MNFLLKDKQQQDDKVRSVKEGQDPAKEGESKCLDDEEYGEETSTPISAERANRMINEIVRRGQVIRNLEDKCKTLEVPNEQLMQLRTELDEITVEHKQLNAYACDIRALGLDEANYDPKIFIKLNLQTFPLTIQKLQV